MNSKFYDKFTFAVLILNLILQIVFANNEVNSDIYDIGVGIADITGQAADVGMVKMSILNFILMKQPKKIIKIYFVS